jgi:hypothetical protein
MRENLIVENSLLFLGFNRSLGSYEKDNYNQQK